MRLGLHRNASREAPHRRLPVKAPGGDDTLFALPTESALVEVVDAWVALSMLAHRRDVADVLLCNQTLLKEHPVAASIPDLPVAGPDPSRWAWDSAARAAGPSWSFRAATRRGRRVGLGWQCSRATPPTGSGALGLLDRRDQALGLEPLPPPASSTADGLRPSPRTPLLITAHRSLGTIRRDQDSAARNAPRCAHWSPGRLSPRGSRCSRATLRWRRAPSRHDRANIVARSLPTCFSRACAARQVRFGLADLTHHMPPNGCCQSSELRAHHEHPQPWRSNWPVATTQASCPKAGRPIQALRGAARPVDTPPPRRRPLVAADLPPKRPGSDTPCRLRMPGCAGRREPDGGAEAAS